MRFLLVDDSKTMRSIQKKILGSLAELPNVEFYEAGDGLEALSVAAATFDGFDLMIIDWNMPKMDGLTFVKKVREHDKKTPLIMATTEAERERVVLALQAGVNNYVVKPFTPESLTQKVLQTLAKAKAA